MNAPHVGQFIDSLDPGGAEEVVINLARKLEEKGFRVTIFHFGNKWLTESAVRHGLTHYKLEGASFYQSKLSLLLFVFLFRKVLRSLNVDLLHSHLLGAVFAGSLTAKIAGIPSLGTLHDTYSLNESAYSRNMLRIASKLRCRLHVVAEEMQSVVSAKTNLNSSTFDVIYNGVEMPAASGARSESSGHRTVRLVCVARLVPIKRIDLMLSAVSRISVEKDWELWIVGDGPERNTLESLASELDIASRVRFLGFRDDVPSILADADIFLQSSDSEGLSVSIIESMAAGLPAIVSNVGGNRELVSPGKTGLLFPKGDADAMTAAIDALLGDDSLRDDFGLNSAVRARELFSSETMAENYVKRYETLLD